ncbi:hypothetical protein FRC02_006373 [Tulasnella sp. 418]|nr:hypothetical protein FRC02_006373 [Tulasnella sp. 418]
MSPSLPDNYFSYVAAPMVNQSDLPFRILTRKYGATLTYTQMYVAQEMLDSESSRNAILEELELGWETELGRPVVVQLAGDDPKTIVEAAKLVEPFCDAVDLNLGCPQTRAQKGHFGGYLLGPKDWPLVGSIVSSLAQSLSVPVHVKIRLCNPPEKTKDLAIKLARAGASVIAIHARFVAPNRRRSGAAQLNWVKDIKLALQAAGLGSTKVLSNGNVRVFEDCQKNLESTGADGIMIGEALLKDPTFLSHDTPRPHTLDICLEYLSLCGQYPVASSDMIRRHLLHVVGSDPKCERTSAYNIFREELESCESNEQFTRLLKSPDLEAWR